jgi:hypothetical protein
MKKISSILVFLCISIAGIAQTEGAQQGQRPDESLFFEENAKTFSLMFVSGSFGNKEHTNSIITTLGEFTGLNPANSFKSTFLYMQKCEVSRVSGKLVLKVSMKSNGTSGRVNAKGFDVTPYLVPDRMDFRLQLLNEAGQVLYELPYTDKDLLPTAGNKYLEVANQTIDDQWPGTRFSLKVNEIIAPQARLLFSHSKEQADGLKVFVSLIRDYEADAAKIIDNNQKIKSFKMDDPDRLQGLLTEIEGYKQTVDQVISKDYTSKLGLKNGDPKKLLPALEEFTTLYHEKKRDLQEMLKTLDDLCYNKGMALYSKNDLKGALEWFNRSLGYNPSHIGSNLQIARIDLQQGRLEEAKRRAEKILTLQPDKATLAEINRLLDSIRDAFKVKKTEEYRAMITEGEKEWARGNKPEGLQKLEEATRFQADNISLIPDNNEAMQSFRKMAETLTSDADRNLKFGKYDLAVRQYREAMDYCSQYAESLSKSGFFQDKIQMVNTMMLESYIPKIHSAITRGEWDFAEKLMDEIFEQLNRNPGLKEPTMLEGLISQLQLGMYAEGEMLVRRKSYGQAFEMLNRCLRFSQKAGVSAPINIYQLMDEARNGVFVSLLLSGQEAMNTHDLQGAEYYLNEAIQFLQNKMSQESAQALDAYKSNLMDVYLNDADRFRNAGQFDKAIGVYERAQEKQYTYGLRPDISLPALISETREAQVIRMLDDAETSTDRKDFGQAIKIAKEAASFIDQYNLAGNAQGKLVSVVDRCFRDMLQEADRLNRAKSYNEALALLTDGWYLCRNYAFRCDENLLVVREQESRTGIQKGMVANASALFAKGDQTGAKTALQEAVRYREAYPDFVTTSKEEEALAGKIRQKEYQEALASGKALLDKKEYRQALGSLDEAVNMEAMGGFTSDPKLKDYRKSAAQKVIMGEADQLEAMLNQGNLAGSKDKILQIASMRAKYDLLDNKELDTRIKLLQGRMVSAACLKQQELYEKAMDNAYGLAKRQNFSGAETEIRKAIDAANKLPECGISDSSATRYLVQLTPAILYQQKYDEAKKLLDQYKNTEAVKAYWESEELYNRGNVKMYGLDHEPLAVFAMQQNLNFILASAFLFRDKGNNAEAMKMLKELAAKGYPAAQTRLLQEQIGFEYGKADALKNPGSAWKTTVLVHTGGSKYWKYFKSAYSKGWKSVK